VSFCLLVTSALRFFAALRTPAYLLGWSALHLWIEHRFWLVADRAVLEHPHLIAGDDEGEISSCKSVEEGEAPSLAVARGC